MRFAGFIGPSYQLRSVNVDCQRCINLYLEVDESGFAKEGERASLVGTPGTELLVDLGAGPTRGAYTTTTGRVFTVAAGKLYELDSSFNQTDRGDLLTITGNVSMADDGFYLIVIDGTYGYKLELATNTFTQINDVGFLGGDTVTVCEGYFAINKPDASGFYISSSVAERVVLGNMNPVFSGEETALDGSPDKTLALLCTNNVIYSFNEKTTEVYFNSGNADFPFERVQGAFVQYGCAARFSAAEMNNAVFWLGRDDKGSGLVYMATGYQPQRISTHAVEQAIQRYQNISDAKAYCYQEFGHYFYVLNFPTADTTWVYDMTTGLWHERAYTLNGRLQRQRGNCHTFAFDTHIVGDYESGKIYKLSSTIYSDDGAPISRVRVTPHSTADGNRVFYNSLELDIEVGVGLDGSGQGVDPQVMLQFSNDGGRTWSSEKWVSIGKIGQTKARPRWNRLGSARDRVFRVSISDPVKIAIVGAKLDATPGGS